MFISSEMASFAASVFSALSGENVFLMTYSMGAITAAALGSAIRSMKMVSMV